MPPSDALHISGAIDKPLTIAMEDIEKEHIATIGDLIITNHLGAYKKEYKNLKGVLLIDLLNKVNITATSPKLLSEYYFVLKATDGYTVVLSWNEIFNTSLGQSFYIVTSIDGQPMKIASERILMIAIHDEKTGRRHIKGLQSIEVKRAE